MPFEVVIRQPVKAKAMPGLFVTVNKYGTARLSKEAFERLGAPESLRVLVDREKHLLAFEAGTGGPGEFKVMKEKGRNTLREVTITSALQLLDAGHTSTRRYTIKADGKRLVADLSKPGEEVVSPRGRKAAAAS